MRVSARLAVSLLLGFASVGVLVLTITAPRMHTVGEPTFEELQASTQHFMNIHVHFETDAPTSPPPPSPVNIQIHFETQRPLPPPPAAPQTHIMVNVQKAQGITPMVPAQDKKITKVVDHTSSVAKNGTITNTKVVTIVTDEKHIPPEPATPPPSEPAVPGHNIIVNVVEHGSAGPTTLPTNAYPYDTAAPSAPKGAIVVNVIDHTPVKKAENALESEPVGGLLPPDWAQHMGANLPPAEPIDSPDANPKVDIYAINFTDETYYFEYCGKRYNEIPPRSVIGQETYGNEVWEIVSEDGIVMIQAKVVEYNQRFVIKNALTEATTADFH